ARRVARRKPIVAVKSGRTETGARAASSHTAALASSDAAANALFAQTGIIRVDTLSDFFSLARLLASQPIPAGKRLGILTNAGGPAILAADAAEAAGLQLPTLSEATQARLRAVLPTTASVANPVDMIAGAGPVEYRACLEALCDEPDLDALLVIFIPPLVTPSTEIAKTVSEVLTARPELTRTVAAVFLDPQAHLTTIAAGKRKVPIYEFPESAVEALAAAAQYGVWRKTPAGHHVTIPLDRTAIDEILAANGAGWLSQSDAAKLFNAAGINIITPQLARSAEEAVAIAKNLNRPLAFKVAEPAVLHKTEVGGVLLNIPADAAAAGYEKLAAQLAAHDIRLEAAAITPMAAPGVEMLAGITHDAVFGPLVACGSGGVLVELLNDVVFRVLPLTDQDATEMVR
ncbi:MAG TPA: acetate--CoA ligase family protein, partial [Roseiflexaceae bacterium]|nr:acetate--CoA ligase family protein [Roseiflexaceae bacterium]